MVTVVGLGGSADLVEALPADRMRLEVLLLFAATFFTAAVIKGCAVEGFASLSASPVSTWLAAVKNCAAGCASP